MTKAFPRHFERYVAIGDSSTEGLNDPDGNGGYRGWSRRLAGRIAGVQEGLLYANFGDRGLTTREILDRQLEPAASMQPDLVSIFSGTNDVLSRQFDASSIERDMEHMQRRFIETGATVLTFTLPDLTPTMPMARLIAPRIHAMNDAVRSVVSRTGASWVDLAAYPVATDIRLWHQDRIHANACGHARIADALAFALELPGTDDSWRLELPPPAPITFGQKLAAEASWTWRYLFPWMAQSVRARIKGQKLATRQPSLEPVEHRL